MHISSPLVVTTPPPIHCNDRIPSDWSFVFSLCPYRPGSVLPSQVKMMSCRKWHGRKLQQRQVLHQLTLIQFALGKQSNATRGVNTFCFAFRFHSAGDLILRIIFQTLDRTGTNFVAFIQFASCSIKLSVHRRLQR